MTSSAPRRHYSFADYLGVEEESRELKHEFVRGEIFAMAGGSVEHAALSQAFGALLTAHLKGGPCRAYSSDLRIRIRDAGVGTYADVSVVCDPVQRDPDSSTHVTNPRVVIEVLSPSTEDYDRDEKRLYYQQLSSLAEYVLVSQDRRRVEIWRREGAGFTRSVYEAGKKAALPSLDFELDVDDLYATAGVSVP
jgi:Uma2 family endonuclease